MPEIFSIRVVPNLFSCMNDDLTNGVKNCPTLAPDSLSLLTIHGKYFQLPLRVMVASYECLDVLMLDEGNSTISCDSNDSMGPSYKPSYCTDQPPCMRYSDTIQCTLPPGPHHLSYYFFAFAQ